MKTIGEIVTGREPSPVEDATLAHVVEIARAWEAGMLPLSGVRTACSAESTRLRLHTAMTTTSSLTINCPGHDPNALTWSRCAITSGDASSSPLHDTRHPRARRAATTPVPAVITTSQRSWFAWKPWPAENP